MVKSFISEHSAEFVLVSDFINIISSANLYKNIVPFYFWKTREGSSISRLCDDGRKIGLIAMFPRRPKIDNPLQKDIAIKFNKSVLETASLLLENNIPTFSGIPLTSSIFNYGYKCPCMWFSLEPDAIGSNEIYISIDLSLRMVVNRLPKYIKGPLRPADILIIVNDHIKPVKWSYAIDILRSITSPSLKIYQPFFGLQYKPVYFIIEII